MPSLDFYYNGEEIICTGGHPFYVIDAAENTRIKGKWITASELEICDKLLLSNGTCAIIQSIGIEALVEPETTYNFEVADSHTYYVSKSNVLVHNKCTSDNSGESANDINRDPNKVESRPVNETDVNAEAWERIQGLQKDANGYTKSTRADGQAIHKGFMQNRGQNTHIKGGGSHGGYGFFDGYDEVNRIVYELKPNNPASIKRGIAHYKGIKARLLPMVEAYIHLF